MTPGPDPAQLIELPESALLDQLGAILLEPGLGFGAEDLDRRRRLAERWLQEHWDEIRTSVCSNPSVREVISIEGGSKAMEAAIVIDALAERFGRPATVVVGVIVARRGLARLCRSDQPPTRTHG